jgi:ABC-2 type transport system permease protein
MRKVLIIIAREYVTRVRKRSFILTTILAPLGFFAFIFFSVLIGGYSSSNKQVAIVDNSGLFADVAFPDAEDGSVIFHREKNLSEVEASAKKAEHSRYDAIIEIPAGYDLDNPKKVGINCLSDKSMGLVSRSYINKVFSEKIRELRAIKFNISQEQLDNLAQEIDLSYKNLSEDGKKSANAVIAGVFGYVIGMAIYILLLVYGMMIMRGVMEEKSNRIMEVLVSSVKPVQLMLGKIIGIAAVGLTQFLLWIVLMSFSSFVVLPLLGLSQSHMQSMPQGHMQGGDFDPDKMQLYMAALHDFHFWPMIFVFFIFFLGGFLLYGSLFAAIGAAGGDDSDSQSLTLPITMPIALSFVLLINVLGQPEGNLALWSSLFPLCSPIIMPALMPFNPPVWQIILSILFLYGGFGLCAILAAKIYRTGILMYGKKTTFREIGRWVFARN